MIDFRYHLVSLVAVFLALAVGIVLGAGPLRTSVGAALTDEVGSLRSQDARLRARVADRDADLRQRDAFIAAATGPLVAGTLAGTSVAVVTLPGAAGAEVSAVTGALETAGATVTGRLAVQDTWVDPGQATFRRTLAAQAAPYLDPRPPADADATTELAQALAQAVVTADPAAPAPPAGSGRLNGLQLLRTAGLVEYGSAPPAPASAAVVLGGPHRAGTSAGASASPSGGGPDWSPLVAALDAGGRGAVLAAPRSATAGGGALAAVRAHVPGGVSTVDSADTPMGVAATVLALAQQVAGGSGQYGSGPGASAPLPS